MPVYTLHNQGSYGLGASGLNGPYTFGTQFSVSKSVSLTGIWFYSGASAANLPSSCAIYDIGTSSVVSGTQNSSPSWSGAAGSGWVKVSYNGSVTLSPGHNYVVVVYANANGWDYDVANYWTTGAGSSGITNGPLSAPKSSSAVNGQAVYLNSVGQGFPTSTSSGYDWGVDVEVTATASGLLMASFP